MITLRPFHTPDDEAPVLALDTSFTTSSVYLLERTAWSFTLTTASVSPPIRKIYPLADEISTLSSMDWVCLACDDGEVVGVAAINVESWNRRVALRHLYVGTSARGQGVGRALIEAAVGEAKRLEARSVWVETQTINYGAIEFYRRMGFEWCGVDTSLYDPKAAEGGEVAVFFSRAVA